MINSTKIFIDGPVGRLESMIQIPSQGKSRSIAILCHPLPTAGGTMDNKVIYTLGQSFHSFGVTTIKWNTRGTGTSAGEFDNGKGEIDDLEAVIDYAIDKMFAEQIWLAGFSFGSAVAFAGARHWRRLASLQQLILLAPPVDRYDFVNDKDQSLPLLLIQGGADEVVCADAVDFWYQQQRMNFKNSEYVYMNDASHFFHGKLVELREILVDKLL